jgi:hypothetical protein
MTWALLWKLAFFASVGGFAIMSVWVSVQGARDIVSLLKTLRDRHETEDAVNVDG